MLSSKAEYRDKQSASSNRLRAFGDGEPFVSRIRSGRSVLERKQQGGGDRSFRQERLDGT